MTAKFSLFTVAALPIIPIALACGGDDDGGKKITVQPDSGMQTQVDAPPQMACPASPSYSPTLGSGDQGAESSGSGAMQGMSWGALLNMDQDIIQVELYGNAGAFAQGGITAKTVQLTGDELNYRTCGACVRIFADVMGQGSAATLGGQFFATGGTLNLTSVSGTFMGTLSNVTLTQVTVAEDFTSTPVPGGCDTAIPNLTMNAPIDTGSATSGEPSARFVTGEMPVRVVLRNRKSI